MDDNVLAQKIQYCDYTIGTTQQGTESRVKTYNISSVPKSLCKKTVLDNILDNNTSPCIYIQFLVFCRFLHSVDV